MAHIIQSIAELENLSAAPTVSFKNPNLTLATMRWNLELESNIQQILCLSYAVSGATFSGVLSQIRTQLVEINWPQFETE